MLSCPLLTLLQFRLRAVKLARERTKPIAELAKELRVSESCLRSWVAQADVDETGGGPTQLTSGEKKELARLRREKRRVEMENEILKRAAAYFDDLSGDWSQRRRGGLSRGGRAAPVRREPRTSEGPKVGIFASIA
jgi:transposase